MKLHIRHRTIYRYEGGTSRVAMLLKLKPRSHGGQSVDEWQVSVNGQPVTAFSPNGHGDLEAFWTAAGRVESAEILAEGVVHTRDTSGVITGLPPGPDPLVYLRETPLTTMSEAMAAHAWTVEGEDDLARLHALSELVRERIGYEPGRTNARTSAAEAFALGAGVCQDHAQIFIAKARLLNIPARYVSGYMLAGEEEQELHETHGWAEAWVPALGWVGFDVTNALCTTDHYVRLTCGLDAHDAAPIRGTAVGPGAIEVDADVRIDQPGAGQGGTSASPSSEQRQQ